MELPAALALLLRPDLGCADQRRLEHCFKFGATFDLAADVADDATKPALQQAQLLMTAL